MLKLAGYSESVQAAQLELRGCRVWQGLLRFPGLQWAPHQDGGCWDLLDHSRHGWCGWQFHCRWYTQQDHWHQCYGCCVCGPIFIRHISATTRRHNNTQYVWSFNTVYVFNFCNIYTMYNFCISLFPYYFFGCRLSFLSKYITRILCLKLSFRPFMFFLFDFLLSNTLHTDFCFLDFFKNFPFIVVDL